jgi:hypothetical protein
MALGDDEDGIDSMEIGATDDEEEIEIPPFSSYVTTWRFWCKFAMWPVGFIVVNVISFSTLLVFDHTEYSFNVPERRTAQRIAMFQTNSAMSAIILLTDLALLLKAAIYMEKEMVALNAVEEDISAAGHHMKHLHAQVSRSMDYFLQKRRRPRVSFFVSLLYFVSVLCGAGFLSCLGLRAYSSSNKMKRDCAFVDRGKQKSNKPIDGLPRELQEWAKRWKKQSDSMYSTFIRLDDGRIFFQGFEAMMANDTDEGGSYEDDVIIYGGWEIDNDATLISVVKDGMIENHPKVLKPRYFTSVNGKSDTESKTFCCSYEEMIDKRQHMSSSSVPQKLLCVASGEDISNGFRNVSLPAKRKNGGRRAYVEEKVKALNGVLYFEYTWYEHDHWSYHKIFAHMEIYKLQPDTMSLESIANITGEESMGTVVSGIGSGDTCKTWIELIMCSLASIVVFPASYWLLVIKEIPSGMAPAVLMAFKILADLANDDFAIALGFVTAIASSIYLLGIAKLPGRVSRESLVWVFYAIICYFTMDGVYRQEIRDYGPFYGPSRYGPRLEVPWWSFVVLSSIVGVLLNHPVLQLMGWIGGTAFVCFGLLFFLGYGSDNELWIMVPAGLVIGCGLVTLGHALTKYRAYVVYYAKKLWRATANAANAGRGGDDMSTGLLSHRDV